MVKPGARRPFVGRKAERAALESALRSARGGALRCVSIEGDAGVGKTRLVREFLSAKRVKTVVLNAHGYRFGSSTPFGLWAEALDSYLRDKPSETIDALCGGSASDLSGILRSVAPSGKQHRTAQRATRPLEGLATLLANLARDRLVIAHLDDIHLADPSSLEALDYLAHNLTEVPMLLILCARPAELSGQRTVQQVILRLEQEDILQRMLLQPLGADEIAALVEARIGGSPFPNELSGWLLERSRGNPLFAVGLLDEMLARGVDLSAPELVGVPTALSERIVSSISELDMRARALVEALAAIGREADLSELTTTTDLSQPDIEDSLATLVARRLVEVEASHSGSRYRIVHPLVQDAIYENIPVTRRRSLHRLIARDLLGADRLAEAASHLVRSAEHADAETVDGLVRAVQRVWSANAFTEALQIMSALFEHVSPGDESALQVLDLLALDGDWAFHHKTDLDYATGIRVLRKAERLLDKQAGSQRMATLDLHLASFLAWGKGDLDEAEHRGASAVDHFRAAGADHEALLAQNELAWIRGVTGDFYAQERAAKEVLAAAEDRNDRASILMALATEAGALWPRGRFADAERDYRSCIEMARADGNQSRLRHGHTLLAMTLALDGRLQDAQASISDAADDDPTGSDVLVHEFAVHVDWFAGELERTIDRARVATSKFGPRRLSVTPAVGALAASEAGNTGRARAFLSSSSEAAVERRRWLIGPYHRWASGLFLSRAGEAQRAVDDLERAASNLLQIGALPLAALVLLDIADIAIEGDPTVATRAAGRLDEIGRELSTPLHQALAAIARAQVDTMAGSMGSATERAQRALELLSGRGYAMFEGRAFDALARSLAERDRAGSVAQMQRAEEIYRRCGAVWRQARSLEFLRRLGKRGKRVAGAGAALTSRERDVVDLAIQGLTAKEIGRRLFIGERTVETHLSNAYAKLGVRTRMELLRLERKS